MNIISQFIFENPSALERAGLIDWHSMVSYHMPTHIASILGLFSTQNALVKLGRVALVICHTTSHQVVHYIWNWKVKSKYQWFFQNLKLKYRNEKESNNTVFENHRTKSHSTRSELRLDFCTCKCDILSNFQTMCNYLFPWLRWFRCIWHFNV